MDDLDTGVCPLCGKAPTEVRTIEIRSCRANGGSHYQLARCEPCKVQLKRRSSLDPWAVPNAGEDVPEDEDHVPKRRRKR